MAYLNPQPTGEELAEHYTSSYPPFTVMQRPGWARRLIERYGIWRRVKRVERLRSGGRILEVGCAHGSTLYALRQTGHWQVTGVEPSAEAVAIARDAYGLELIATELNDAHLPEAFYDVVAMWDVLEHVPSPLDTLREVHRVLKPDGLLVMRVPVSDAWDAKLFGRYWAGWDAPRHLVAFTSRHLDLCLEAAGFRVVSSHGIQSSYSILAMSMRFLVNSRLPTRVARRLDAALQSAALRTILVPLSWLVSTIASVSSRDVVACPVVPSEADL